MTNSALIQKLVGLVKRETDLTLEVIQYLREVDARDLHLEMSYSNLFEFATKFLGYSDGAAFRRINAMRLIQSEPDVEEKIRKGDLTLSTAARVEAFCKKSGIDRKTAVQQVLGKSTREAERLLFDLAPSAVPEERTRPVSATHTEIRLIVDAELKRDLDRMLELLSHVNPNSSYAEVVARATREWLRKNDPTKSKLTSAPKSSADARAANGKIRKIILKREDGQCTYTDPATGRRCASRRFTQVDHIHAWSNGGQTVEENLRTLCGAHNRYIWRTKQRSDRVECETPP